MLDATARAEDTHFWFRGLRRNAQGLLRDALAGRATRQIVDCGAGTGRNLDWLMSFGHAVGVERSAAGLRVARQHRRPIVRGDVAMLPFADATIDVVTSFDVLYCLDDRTEIAAMREMWRVLRPGGLVMINTAALDVLRGAHSTLTMERRRYTRRTLQQLLTAGGFRICRMTYTNMATFPVTLLVRWLDRATGRAAKGSAADLQVPIAPVNAAFNGLLAVEAQLLRLVNLPIGSSLLCVAEKPVTAPRQS